jgi:signal transduction histidine kinase
MLDALRAETTRRRGRWNSVLVLLLWVPLAAFADPLSFGDVWGGLPYRLPTALGFLLLWLWLRPGKQRPRRAVEFAVMLAFSFLFLVWGAFVFNCSADTVLPAMLSIVGGAMVVASGLTLSWQSTALLCLVADAAMLGGGLLRTPPPEPTYFMLVATALIIYPFVVSSAAARDRRYFAELESSRKLAELNEQLRLEQDARTRLFVNLSHDFRTPLAVIRAEVELLRGADADEPGRALARIDSNAAAVVDLVEQLLELARLDVGKTPLSARCCDLRALSDDVVAQLRPPRADIDLRLHADGDCLALVDPVHFRRVLQNLIDNGLRQLQTQGGEVSVTIRSGPDASLLVEVADSGPGIAVSLRARLFERFASFRPEGGMVSGIGLALARELSELNGGQLRLLEDATQTTFQLRLPRAAPHAVHAAAVTSLVPVAAPYGAGDGALPLGPAALRPQILLVEDNADLRSALQRLLAADFVVIPAGSLSTALRALSHGIPAAILSDVMLPDGDGYGLLAALRARPALAHVPVLFISALADPSEHARGLAAGADDYISKPFSSAELVARLKTAIRRSSDRWAAVVEQRDELLSELHDGVCGSLASALIALDELNSRPSAEPLRRATSSVQDGLREARELLGALGTMPESLDDVVSYLRWETACASDRAGLELDFRVVRDAEATHLVSPASLHALRRVAAEAIVNAARHGAARAVNIQLAVSPGELRLRVDDDGRGNAEGVPPGVGLSGLRRRVHRLGGSVTFGNGTLGGYVVEASFPANEGVP